MISPPRRSSWAVVFLCLACLAAGMPANAASRTTFNPSVSLDVVHTDDINYAGAGQTADTSFQLGAVLPVNRDWQTGSLGFSYAPSIRRYLDETSFDNEEHRLNLSLANSLGRSTTLGFDAGYSLSQSQGDLTNPQNSGFTLTQRSEREAIDGSVSLSSVAGRAWSWNASVRGGSRVSDSVQSGQPLNALEDQKFYAGSLGFGHAVTRKTSIGLSYDYTHVDFDTTGEEDINDFRFTFDHQLSRSDTIGFDVGASNSSFDATMPNDDDDSTGFTGSFRSNHTLRTVTLGTFVSHQPNSGGFRAGGSDYTTVSFSVAGVGTVKWGWAANARYSVRDPSADDQDSIEILGIGAGVERTLPKNLGLTFDVRWFDQSSDNPVDEAEVVEASLGLVWYPRGRAPRG